VVQLHVLEVVAVTFRAANNVVGGGTRAQELVEVAATHVLKQQAHGPADGAHGQQLDDVWVLKFGQQARLALKVLSEVFGRLVLQHLHRHDGEFLAFHQSRRLGLGQFLVLIFLDVFQKKKIYFVR
jgi:hypothetical protein